MIAITTVINPSTPLYLLGKSRQKRTLLITLKFRIMSKIVKVKAVQDEDSHWYIIPSNLSEEFFKDLENEDLVDNGDFDIKYGDYSTGGDLNLTQLYAKI